MRYFEYERVAEEAHLSQAELASLSQIARREFPKDDMMYELHLVRICMAIRDGYITLESALKPELEPASHCSRT